MEVKIYTATVTRDEDAWLVEVPEVERVTQALDLRQVEPMARGLIAIMDLSFQRAQQILDEARKSA